MTKNQDKTVLPFFAGWRVSIVAEKAPLCFDSLPVSFKTMRLPFVSSIAGRITQEWMAKSEYLCPKSLLPRESCTDPQNNSSIKLSIYKKPLFLPRGISFAQAIFQKNIFGEEEGMSRLFHFFKNHQIKKQVKARIEMWLVSERLKEGFSVTVLPVKH
jgi:hypothetical protein